MTTATVLCTPTLKCGALYRHPCAGFNLQVMSPNQRKLRSAILCKSQNLMNHQLLLPEESHQLLLQQPGLLQSHSAEVVSLANPIPSPGRAGQTWQAKPVTSPPPARGTTPCPASCAPAPVWTISNNLETAVLDKLGRLTNHFLVICSIWTQSKSKTFYLHALTDSMCNIPLEEAALQHSFEQNYSLNSLASEL